MKKLVYCALTALFAVTSGSAVAAATCSFERQGSEFRVWVDVIENSVDFRFISYLPEDCGGLSSRAKFVLNGEKDFDTRQSSVDISFSELDGSVTTYTSTLFGSQDRYLRPADLFPLLNIVWTFSAPVLTSGDGPSLFPGGFQIFGCAPPNRPMLKCGGDIYDADHIYYDADGEEVSQREDYVSIQRIYSYSKIAPVPVPMTGALATSAFSILLLLSRRRAKMANLLT